VVNKSARKKLKKHLLNSLSHFIRW
jgi:hypothetical protein